MNLAIIILIILCGVAGIVVLDNGKVRIGLGAFGVGLLLLIWVLISWNCAVLHPIAVAPVTTITDNRGYEKQVFAYGSRIVNINTHFGCFVPPGGRIEISEYRWSLGIYWGVSVYEYRILPSETGPEKGGPP